MCRRNQWPEEMGGKESRAGGIEEEEFTLLITAVAKVIACRGGHRQPEKHRRSCSFHRYNSIECAAFAFERQARYKQVNGLVLEQLSAKTAI